MFLGKSADPDSRIRDMIKKNIPNAVAALLLVWVAGIHTADLAAQEKSDKSAGKPAAPPKELHFKLTVEEANTILEALGTLPFTRTHDLIAKIQRQAQDQLQRNPDPQASPQPRKK